MELTKTKTFFEGIPKVPKAAFVNLKGFEGGLESDSNSSESEVYSMSEPLQSTRHSVVPIFSPLFSQPSCRTDFFSKLRDQKVILESASMSENCTIKGIIRVLNLDYHKHVFVHYTMDEWITTCDKDANYVTGDGFSDKFAFSIDVNCKKDQMCKKVHFCICFECNNCQYWDNNTNKNYTFQCFDTGRKQTKN